MSRLFNDRVLIALSPDSLELARISGGFRPHIVEKRVIACDPHFGTEAWQGSVSTLAAAVGEMNSAKANATIVLSNHFVRYTLIPASSGLNRAEEELAFARYCFSKIHGERSKTWNVRLSSGAAGSQRIASAIDGALFGAIGACFPRRARTRLVSIQPYMMAAFNRWRRQIGAGAAWLLLVEPRRACLAGLDNGRWTSVRNTRGEFDRPEQWAGLLDRERHLVAAGASSAGVFVHTPRSAWGGEVQSGDWRFKTLLFDALRGFVPIEDARLAMALTAQ